LIPEEFKKKIEEFAVDALEREFENKPQIQTYDDSFSGQWRQIKERKWELRIGDTILGTIYAKYDGKYSLWFTVPIILKKYSWGYFNTYLCDSLEDAKKEFNQLLIEKALPWCQTVVDYLKTKNV
jgi:hypothetical protein